MKSLKRSEFDKFIIRWDSEFSIDLWWRRKYNVPFNSLKHRESSFIDMYFEYREEKLIMDLGKQIKSERENKEDFLFTGKWLKRRVERSTEEEINEWMGDMSDLKKINEQVNKDTKNG